MAVRGEVWCAVSWRGVRGLDLRSALDSEPLGFTRELEEVMVVEEPDEGESWKI
jgi:hypothetical protein